jgi:hypothetical protein
MSGRPIDFLVYDYNIAVHEQKNIAVHEQKNIAVHEQKFLYGKGFMYWIGSGYCAESTKRCGSSKQHSVY